MEILPRPAYSPDINPASYYLIRLMREDLEDTYFQNFEAVKKWIDIWINSRDEDFFLHGINLLPEKWIKVVEKEGKYFD